MDSLLKKTQSAYLTILNWARRDFNQLKQEKMQHPQQNAAGKESDAGKTGP